jgi:hypothetical protein
VLFRSTGSLAGADSTLKDVTSRLKTSIKEAALEKVKEQIEVQKPEEPTAEPEEPVAPAEPSDPIASYETRFHHTQTAGPDSGKSLVLCPGQRMDFDQCVSGGVEIPRHKDGDGRETYWAMDKEPDDDIRCTKDGKTYLYPATITDSRGFVWGKC